MKTNEITAGKTATESIGVTEMQKNIFGGNVSLKDTSEDLSTSEIKEFSNLFSKDEEESKRERMEKVSISDKQIGYIKYLAFKNKCYNKLNMGVLENMNMWQASKVIERLN